MFTSAVSLVIATTLSFHPYAVGRRAAPETIAEPAPSTATPSPSNETAPAPPPRASAAAADERVQAAKGEEMHEVVRPFLEARKGSARLRFAAGLAGRGACRPSGFPLLAERHRASRGMRARR